MSFNIKEEWTISKDITIKIGDMTHSTEGQNLGEDNMTNNLSLQI